LAFSFAEYNNELVTIEIPGFCKLRLLNHGEKFLNLKLRLSRKIIHRPLDDPPAEATAAAAAEKDADAK
jgi:hypothetical protein